MEKSILKLIQLRDNRFTGEFRTERPLTTSFSILSDFDFVLSEVRREKFINGKVLSCSYILQLTAGEAVSANLPVFHNLYSPDIIFNDEIEKICWSLRYRNREICAGKVINGHSFQFDWDLIDGINTSNNNFPAAYQSKNQQLEDDIRSNLEELGKHFFTVQLDLSKLVSGSSEYELSFDFPGFRSQRSVDDVQLLFNVVPVVDVVRSYEFFHGVNKGFNLKSLCKVKPAAFLGVTGVLLEDNHTKKRIDIMDGDFEEVSPGESYYKLLLSTDLAEKEQEILYQKNCIPFPYDKSMKAEIINKLKGSQKIPSTDIAVIEAALERNLAEVSGTENNPAIVVNNNHAPDATVYVKYLIDTSNTERASKEIFHAGNSVGFDWVPVELAGKKKVKAPFIVSKYDYYCAAKEFFGSQNITNVTVAYTRDFNMHSIWTGTIEVKVETATSYAINYSQWSHFVFICKSRSLYKEIDMKLSITKQLN